ncbi:MAG TPA: hypothetical protein VGC39_06055, partial [Candidatus Methylacidiphilales bacterium]
IPAAMSGAGTQTAEQLGIEIHLDYSPLPRSTLFTFPPPPEPNWTPLPAKAAPRIDLPFLPPTLASLQKQALFQLDLAQWYDVKLPGTYRLVFKFKKGALVQADAALSPKYFELLP